MANEKILAIVFYIMFSILLILNIVSNVMFAIGMVSSKFKP